MIISPVLNSFSKNADEKIQRYVVFSFFLFETLYGWVTGGRRFFVDGYGPLHFIGLYLTAQYIHNQLATASTPIILKKLFSLPKWVDFSIFLLMAIINTFIITLGSMYLHNVEPFHAACYAYSNPLNIIGGVYLLLFFSKLKMHHSKIINWMGASSFAVYLLHSECTIRSHYFTPQIQYLFETNFGISCIMVIFFFLCIVYIASILIDQIRIWTWGYINKGLFNNK
jgi:peptidoglycan/LPS O-acetylase OafA/YrhL